MPTEEFGDEVTPDLIRFTTAPAPWAMFYQKGSFGEDILGCCIYHSVLCVYYTSSIVETNGIRKEDLFFDGMILDGLSHGLDWVVWYAACAHV